MKVLILCGGRGTRLREYTEVVPKPLVEIGGRPILWHIMKLYAHFGLCDFVLLLGYKGHLIRQYFLDYEALSNDLTIELGRKQAITYHGSEHGEDGWKVTLVDTGQNTMTGARVKRAERFLGEDERFCLTYGDGVADVDIGRLLAFHREHGRLATVTGVRPPSRFGLITREGPRVAAFEEKPQLGDGVVNGGFFVLERAFLDYLDADDACFLEHEPLERCAAEGQLFLFEHEGFWHCMDTLRDWERLEQMWLEGRAPWKVWA